ncbi:MAG: purine-nucleoside phosphorylase [Chloroflexota bacterium]
MEELTHANLGPAIRAAADLILDRAGAAPRLGIVLGSGLGPLADEICDPTVIPYEDIPYFPRSTVPGHAGRMVIGQLAGQRVLAMQGRFHYYEGHSLLAATFPIRVMKALGIRLLILTNAAGGLNPDLRPGDLMLITDHVNLTGQNPLIGPNDDRLGPRFPDMSRVYRPDLCDLARRAADREGLVLREGIYIWLTGPNYETPAEVRYLRRIGDAVGMSTVPEAIVATHAGLPVMALSCITNVAGGMGEKLDHAEVMAMGARVAGMFARLMKAVIAEVGELASL